MKIFFYGSLMAPHVIAHATGITESKTWTTQKGILNGYKRFKVKNALYPGIQRHTGSTVEGLVVDIPEHFLDIATERLDIFEDVRDGLYERVLERVVIKGDHTVDAWVYVFTGPALMVTNDPWSFQEFQVRQDQFLSEYGGL